MQGFDLVNFFSGVWPFLILAFIFWWMIDRPHKKEEKKRQRMLESLKKGDKVVTVGGMYGTITRLSEKKVVLKVCENVEVEFLRTAISAYQDPAKQEKRKSFLKFVKTWKLNSCARQSAPIRTLPNRSWLKSNNG